MNPAIATVTLLVHPQPDVPTEMWCDASNIAVGAVLIQLQHVIWKPLRFWSRQLNNAQRNYSATDRELLAVSYAVDKFRSYLEGQPIVVRTDHKPLVGYVTMKAVTALPIPRRHLLKIAQFVDKLHYLKAERNGVADALSRVRLQCKVATATNAIGIWMSEQDDVADTLPTEGSHYAIQEDALVEQPFLQQRKRQRDVHNKQLRAPVVVPEPMTTQVSSETQSVSPPFSPSEGELHTSSSADHDTCTSSVPSPDFRSAQEHDQPLQSWSTHHRSSATRFKLDVIECADGTSLWADVSATPARILVGPTDLAKAHCFRQYASYLTPRIQGRTDACQTVLLLARHQQRRCKVDTILCS